MDLPHGSASVVDCVALARPGSDSWQIELGSSPGGTDRGVFVIGSDVLSASGALADGDYVSRVRGRNAASVGPASNEVQFTVGAVTPCGSGAPDPPVLLSATVVDAAVTVSWRPPTNADVQEYRILVGSQPGASDLATFDVGAVTSFVANAPRGNRYHLSLVAMNACGTSQPSKSIVVDVP